MPIATTPCSRQHSHPGITLHGSTKNKTGPAQPALGVRIFCLVFPFLYCTDVRTISLSLCLSLSLCSTCATSLTFIFRFAFCPPPQPPGCSILRILSRSWHLCNLPFSLKPNHLYPRPPPHLGSLFSRKPRRQRTASGLFSSVGVHIRLQSSSCQLKRPRYSRLRYLA